MDDSDNLNNSFDRLLLDSDLEDTGSSSEDSNSFQNGDILSDDEMEDSQDENDLWSTDIMDMNDMPFMDLDSGWNNEALSATTPLDHCSFYLDPFLEQVMIETNRYEAEKSRSWKNVDIAELKIFVGLCLKMGIVKLPQLRDYWCASGDFGEIPICSKFIIRSRFEDILRHLHLNDNAANSNNDRLHKIRPVIETFSSISTHLFRPSRNICIDESLVPFRGRVVFRQYIPNKRHRYGLKLFKLCSEGGYTWKLQLYPGKDPTRQGSVAEAVVMQLMDGLMDQGRTLFTDNWHTSVTLAEKMLDRSTNLIDTIKRNRVDLPKEMKDKKLKKGDMIAMQNQKGVTVVRWKDKRELFMLSTMGNDSRSPITNKPMVVHAYNEGKIFVDTSDQMASYTPFVRRTCKWYVRLFFHILTQTALVNSWKLYAHNKEKISLTGFKVLLVRELLYKEETSRTSSHRLEIAGPARTSRKRCLGCYHELAKTEDSKTAGKKTKRVSTRCNKCQNSYCVECFSVKHKRCL